jgi:thiosulfate/3-mercaptopyruvate sulfurtransferase
MLPPEIQFATEMGMLGVDETCQVILYSGNTMRWASRVSWMLRVFGFDNAAALDGGLQKWQKERRPLESGPSPSRPPTVRAYCSNLPGAKCRQPKLAGVLTGAACFLLRGGPGKT